MSIVRAKVLTNSSDDEQRRVKIYSPHVYEPSSDLIEVVGRQPLNKGDLVLVDITSVFNPLIIGKCFTANAQLEGHNLFRISVDDNWTEASVSASKLAIKNNEETEVIMEGDTVTVKAAKVLIQGAGDSDNAEITLNGGGNGRVMNVSSIVDAINSLYTTVHTIQLSMSTAASGSSFANPFTSYAKKKADSIKVADVSDANFKH